MKSRECRNILAAIGAVGLATGLMGPPSEAALAETPVYVFTRLATVPGPGPGTTLFNLYFDFPI